MITDEGAVWNVIAPKKLLSGLNGPASRKCFDIECRCALAARVLGYILAMALVDARTVPPPNELMAKHFNGLTRTLIEYERDSRSISRSKLLILGIAPGQG